MPWPATPCPRSCSSGGSCHNDLMRWRGRAGSRNIEEIFRELVALSRVLTEEQDRHVREHLSEEELTIFDILTRPGPDLTTDEREEVKKVARHLLARHALGRAVPALLRQPGAVALAERARSHQPHPRIHRRDRGAAGAAGAVSATAPSTR